MSWWKILVVLSSLVCWGHAQAPGDGDSICLTGAFAILHPSYPKTFKPLMDSRDYDQILANEVNTGAVWQQVDVDGNLGDGGVQTTWVQDVNLRCRQTVTVCGFSVPGQDNWLITQHISREVGGVLLKQIIIMIEFEFATCANTGDCSQTFTVHSRMTSTINAAVAATDPVNNFGLLSTVAPNDITGEVRQNATIEIDFDDGETETGFYLAVRDLDSCIKIHRVLVYYSVCPAVIQDLIGLPESIAPPLLSTPIEVDMETCVMNAIPMFGQATPRARCFVGGQWSIVRECECVGGFQRNRNGTACEACAAGEDSVQGGNCQSCPANSNSGAASPACPCNEGYYRAASEGPETKCTQPPSAPQNLSVVNFTNTTVYLTWEAPMSDGGRNDTEYELSYERVDGSEPQTVYGKVTVTEGEITGLTPFTEYIVSVSAENGVSSLATDATGRTATVTITTSSNTDEGKSDSGMSTGVVVGASIGGGFVLLLLISSTVALICFVAARKYKRKLPLEAIPEYASVNIVPTTGLRAMLRPDLPQRNTGLRVEKNIAYELENQPANTNDALNCDLPCVSPKQLPVSETTSHVTQCENHIRSSIVRFDDDGYPLIELSGPTGNNRKGSGGVYLDLLPPHSEAPDTLDTATPGAIPLVPEEREVQGIQDSDDDGYPSLWP